MRKFEHNWDSLKVDISEAVEDRQYMIPALEDLLGDKLVNLVQDVPEALDSLQNYFSFNPKR